MVSIGELTSESFRGKNYLSPSRVLTRFVCFLLRSALGTHVSFVRSVKMDSWSDVQLEKMRIGGNQQCVEFLKGHGVSIRCADSQEEERKANNSLVSIRERYDCATAMLYQQVLKARQENRPEPTELPEYTSAADRLAKLKIMQGFGSSHNLEASPALRPKKLEALERGVSHLWNSLTDKLEVSLEPKDPSSPPDKNTPFKGAPPLETLERSVSSIWNNLTDNISKLKQ